MVNTTILQSWRAGFANYFLKNGGCKRSMIDVCACVSLWIVRICMYHFLLCTVLYRGPLYCANLFTCLLFLPRGYCLASSVTTFCLLLSRLRWKQILSYCLSIYILCVHLKHFFAIAACSLRCMVIIMTILLVTGDSLCVGVSIVSHIRSITAGMHEPLFVATNLDPVDMVLGASQWWEKLKRIPRDLSVISWSVTRLLFCECFCQTENTCYFHVVISFPSTPFEWSTQP